MFFELEAAAVEAVQLTKQIVDNKSDVKPSYFHNQPRCEEHEASKRDSN